ncbi:MAG: diguanylate cyclase [Holosporaceae bacterium]|jgi:two-component system cell cycle response regulator|nr:diguanylate cyclase [Holosporaceae bacterium]
MVAKVLVINEDRTNFGRIILTLKKSFFQVLSPKSTEDSLRIIGTKSIDAVLISAPTKISNLFWDFLSILRQLCGVIPIIGVLKSKKSDISPLFVGIVDDFIHLDVHGSILIRRINSLVRMKSMFDGNLLSYLPINGAPGGKIVAIFHEQLDFLHESILKNIEVVQLKSLPPQGNDADADLFLINADHTMVNKCCASIHLKQSDSYRPIVLTFDKTSRERARQSLKLDLGCTDVINVEADKVMIACRLVSLIKYKKLYESFSTRIKRSLHLFAIDPTTEVYNRSFLEDFLARKDQNFTGSAILMIDIDKFKFINDKFGHSFADSMLKHVSGNIKRYVRSSDVIARYGGDEFIIIMKSINRQMALEIANRIQKKVENSPFGDVRCTVSIGVCCLEYGGNLPVRDAILVADKFMYIAKQSGGNSVKICA